mmetsp:Transcript_3562/g.10909  ORF Transcript_3562/g.10909 Transcript_3562/m.10909 type:complete len:407 (+) Transcript_3562:77-1297(+)
MASLIWLGALLGVFASMTGTVGKQLLRFSELQRLKGTKPALCLARACLVGGLVLNTIVGPIVDMASYAFAPQSVIAPLGGLDVVWNTLSAPCTLGETLTVQLLLGCGLIAGGATATSCFGSKEDQKFTPEVLKETLFRWTVLAYCVVLLAWLLFNILVLIPRSAAPKGQPFATGDKLRGLSLGMTAGSIAGNMFCVKAFVEVVQASIEDGKSEYWLDWLPYVLFAGALFFALTNLYFLTKAMREYEALFMGAVFEGSLITAACVSGVVVFSELDGLMAWQIALYWLAVASIVGGIFTVARGCMANGGDGVQVFETDCCEPTVMAVPSEPLPLHKEPEPLPAMATLSLPVSPRRSQRPGSRPSSAHSDSPFRDVPLVVKEAQNVRQSSKQHASLSPSVAGQPAPAWP